MGIRIGSRYVRHGGNCGSSLADGSVNGGFFDGHLNQSICVLDIPHRPIGRHLCAFEYHGDCTLRIEKPCLVIRSRRRLSAGCTGPPAHSICRMN